MDLPVVYDIYFHVASAFKRTDAYQALRQPLIVASNLLYYFLMDSDWCQSEQIVISSASCKTGLGLTAFLAKHVGRPYAVVGLTSGGNVEFVKELGFCDQVVICDGVKNLNQVKSVYVDIAGKGDVKKRLHARLAGYLNYSSAVGIS